MKQKLNEVMATEKEKNEELKLRINKNEKKLELMGNLLTQIENKENYSFCSNSLNTSELIKPKNENLNFNFENEINRLREELKNKQKKIKSIVYEKDENKTKLLKLKNSLGKILSIALEKGHNEVIDILTEILY